MLTPPAPPAAAHSALRRWLCAAGLAVTTLLGACAGLVGPNDARPAQAPGTAKPVAMPRTAIRLVVLAPATLRILLERHLDLAKLAQLPDDDALGSGEVQRLIAATPAQARDLLQTEGHFDAVVQVQRAPERADGLITVTVQVDPGPATRVTALKLQMAGELSEARQQDPAVQALIQALTANTDLRPGSVFRNADWSATKPQLLGRLRSAGYASPSLKQAAADIDTEARTAVLSLTVDSGPMFKAGGVQISGLVHQDEATVRHLAGMDAGAPLTESSLQAYQDRLQKSRLFQSVNVSFDADPANAAAAPVRVRLTELPLQQATVGVGVNANTGPRVTLEHTHRRPFDWPVIAYNKFEWGAKTQLWSGDFQTHPGAGGYRSLIGVQLDRTLGDTDTVLSQRLRMGRTQDTPRLERLYFLEWLRSRQDDLSAASAATPPVVAMALSGNYHLVWRDLDSALLPTRGLALNVQTSLGQATSNTGDSGPYARLYARLTGYLPLGGQWYGQGRLEAGQIVKRPAVTVPDALGFRAGGDESVRGYAYRSLAPVDAAGATISGTGLFTSSVEVAHPISAELPSVWGALFVDAGRAVDHWGDFKPAWGYGLGLRWRSPIGPLRVDLARANETRKLRLHLSVGMSF